MSLLTVLGANGGATLGQFSQGAQPPGLSLELPLSSPTHWTVSQHWLMLHESLRWLSVSQSCLCWPSISLGRLLLQAQLETWCLLRRILVLFVTANRCQKLPINAKFEKVGSEKCQLATLMNELAQHVNETNKHRDWLMIWMSNLAAQIETQKLTNQIKSQSVRQIKLLNCQITPKKTPKSRFKSQSQLGFAHHW